MPMTRTSLRTRGTMNENDENGPAARVTRAKVAALNTDSGVDALKKPVQTKRATGATTRKRPALGDVSNFKNEGDVKGGNKASTAKGQVATKPQGGVQKPTGNKDIRAPNSGPRLARKKPETKQKPLSGPGAINSHKRPSTEKKADPQEEPPLKKQNSRAKMDVKDTWGGEKPLDLDTEDLDDPLMAAEYVVEIFDYLKDLELVTLPNPEYIDHQPDLEWKMRGILVDWLIEVHTRFRLLPETLFLAVNIIDRFLSAEVVALDRLQLVGVTAMFIASKYEEVLSPHVANFSHVADETFSDKEILDAERHVLATLEYNMSFPNPMNFLRRISKADNYDIQTRTLGKYLMEISLLDHRFMGFPQSQIAAASMYLARLILERGPWDATLSHYAGYTEEEIDPVFRLMIDYLHRPVSHEAFFKKYASKKFLKASILTRQWAKKYHGMYIDSSLSEPYTYIKDSEQ
ncbi:hypothetical protein N7533_005514 [Penicillium manginii]|uniref:uncharacterized protein n=1 Tax=Penicillium manginii TaxID=203109 RepID=UPI0025471164|nr:uncharacterized protein N7533_005514 [Penicillium manginii]KAJ5755971.1 hypothetical protein N7533_005514 [Penicillium manginii]